MATVWIFQIYKNYSLIRLRRGPIKKLNISLFLIGSLFLTSCSGVNKTLKKIFGKEKVEKVKAPEVKVDYGVTNKKVKNGFVDATKKYGLEGVEGVRFYAVDFDFDNDTDLVVLPTFFGVPEFYEYQRLKKRFKKLSYYPFPVNIQGSFLNFVDFNKDGVLDVIVGTLNQKSEVRKEPLRIFQGKVRRGKILYREIYSFIQDKDLKKIDNLALSSVSVVDYDLDGKLDLYLGSWFKYPKEGPVKILPDMFLKGDRFKFYNYSPVLYREYEKDDSDNYLNATPTFASSTCDIDQDGYPDILTASSNGYRNKLWMNRYDGKRKVREYRDFGEISGFGFDLEGSQELTGGGFSNFAACADYNSDGIMDIFLGELTHSYQSEKVDRSSILTGSRKNFPPKFLRTAYSHEENLEWTQSDRRGVWGDFNFDGRIDLLVDNSGYPPRSRLVLFDQQPDKSYSDVAPLVGVDITNPTGSVKIDINSDGRPDIITGQSDIRSSKISNRIFVFENQMPRKKKRAIRFFIRGRKSNYYGLGALVSLRTTKGLKTSYVETSRGAQPSQNEEGVHFGLAPGEKIIWVKVRYPFEFKKGIMERKYKVSDLKFNRFLDVTLCENGKVFPKRKRRCY